MTRDPLHGMGEPPLARQGTAIIPGWERLKIHAAHKTRIICANKSILGIYLWERPIHPDLKAE